ncbi:MAG: DUF1015 domain-containing protein [Dehalococcoidales bacterium]
MADISPFQGVRYNQSLVTGLASVVCPPYDIITPAMQQELYHRSQYNFVHVEYNRELPQDTDADNRYTRSAATLEQWLAQDILKADDRPAIYLHDHFFAFQGKRYRRRGIVARVRLEEWERGVVRPHEGTMSEPRGDRLSLLRALRANTSSILAVYQDPAQNLSSLLATLERSQPVIQLSTTDGEKHEVRAVTETGVIDRIRRSLENQTIYIADGHHRYESALAYRQERRARLANVSGDEGFNFVMMTLVDFADPGLVILPPHRMARGIPKAALDGLLSRLQPFFEITELSLGAAGAWERVDEFLGSKTDQVRLVLFGLMGTFLFLLKLRSFAATDPMMPNFHSELYRRLDVSIVDHIILEGMLGLPYDAGETSLAYSYDRREAVGKVREEEYQLALLLSPVRAEVIQAVADAGDRMPRKSTYFYPKLPSGLILHRLD